MNMPWIVVIIVHSDNDTKESMKIDKSSKILLQLLDDIQADLFNQAQDFMDAHTSHVSTWDEFKQNIDNGFVVCGWDGTKETETKIKQETKATIRCLPFDQNIKNLKCIYSDNDAKYLSIFAKSY